MDFQTDEVPDASWNDAGHPEAGEESILLPRYMIDFSESHIPNPFGPVDDRGVPLWDPSSTRLRGAPLYHPIVIIQYGLAHYDRLIDGDRSAEEVFETCARWVEENAIAEPQDRFVVWPYSFPLRTPPVKPPWVSGMAQGQALSLLSRAWLRTRSPTTAAVARRAARSFCYTLQEGGVVSEAESGALFIEEVVHSPALHILNGCLYGLYGLHEYVQTFADQEVQPFLDRCVQGVDEALPLFDMGWWSRYSLGLRSHIAPPYYHDVHIQQLRCLAAIFDRPEYDRYARRWELQLQSPALRRRRSVLGAIEVNINRMLTITRLDRIKYRRVPALGE